MISLAEGHTSLDKAGKLMPISKVNNKSVLIICILKYKAFIIPGRTIGPSCVYKILQFHLALTPCFKPLKVDTLIWLRQGWACGIYSQP